MQPAGPFRSLRWLAAAALAFAALLAVLLLLAGDATRRYAELPDPLMRVGLPVGYEYCVAGSRSLGYSHHVICDRSREAESASSFTARYQVFTFSAQTSAKLGYDFAKGIESARDGLSRSYFSDGIRQGTDPAVGAASTIVDGLQALEFTRTSRVSLNGRERQELLIVIALEDGRLAGVANTRQNPLSAEDDAANIHEIVRGIKFHEPN